MPFEPAVASAAAEAQATSAAARRRGFWILFASLFNTGVSNSMLFAILPSFAREVGVGELSVGATFVVAAFFFTIMSQVWGGMSDRVGRRPLIVLGLAGAALSMWAMAATIGLAYAQIVGVGVTAAMLIGSRAIFGLLNSATNPSAVAWVADRSTPSSRTKSIAALTSGFGTGAALGPVVAAALMPVFGYSGPFVITGLVALIAAGAVALFLPERTPPKDRERARVIDNVKIAGDARVREIMVFSAAIWTVQASVLQTMGFAILDRLALDAEAGTVVTGVALSAGAVAALVAQLVIIPRMNPSARAAMVAGSALNVLAALMFFFANSGWAFVLGLTLSGMGMGMVRPGASSAASLAVTPEEQGAVAGLIAATAGVGFFFSPIVGVGLYAVSGPSAVFAVTALVSLAALTLAIRSKTIAAASARATFDLEAPPPEHR